MCSYSAHALVSKFSFGLWGDYFPSIYYFAANRSTPFLRSFCVERLVLWADVVAVRSRQETVGAVSSKGKEMKNAK